MSKIPTVTIWDPLRGAVDINASEYDSGRHRLYQGEGEVPAEEPVTFGPSDVDAPALRVERTSEAPEWWKVLDADDEPVGKALRSESAARQALRELIADGD